MVGILSEGNNFFKRCRSFRFVAAQGYGCEEGYGFLHVHRIVVDMHKCDGCVHGCDWFWGKPASTAFVPLGVEETLTQRIANGCRVGFFPDHYGAEVPVCTRERFYDVWVDFAGVQYLPMWDLQVGNMGKGCHGRSLILDVDGRVKLASLAHEGLKK